MADAHQDTGYEIVSRGSAEITPDSQETIENRLRGLRALEAITNLPDDMPDEQKATAVYDPVDRDAYPENEVDLSEEER